MRDWLLLAFARLGGAGGLKTLRITVTTSLLLGGMSAHETQTDAIDSKIEWAHRHGQAVDQWALTVLLGVVAILLILWA